MFYLTFYYFELGKHSVLKWVHDLRNNINEFIVKKKKEKIWSNLNEKQKSFTRHLESLKTQKI